MGVQLQHYYSSASGNVVNGTDAVYLSNPIPAEGEAVLLELFGATDSSASDVAACICLEWGKTGDWEFVRSASNGAIEYEAMRDFIGDGEKRFRITRTVLTAGKNAQLDYWMKYATRIVT